jgi:ubiquinone/menaquinone biosynthesis C-methylase UbiE
MDDATYFDEQWQRLFSSGEIPRVVPDDETIWRRDLGRARRIAFEWLGDLRGKRVLELGCGPGDEAVMMARRGAWVVAVDIAPASVWVTRARAEATGVAARVVTSRMCAEQLAFPSDTFDWVTGFGLLHHAQLDALAPEIRRVLRRGGHALFFEPLGMNPLLEFARQYLPYRDKRRSANEHPLKYEQIARVGAHFSATRVREVYLFSMITRAIGDEASAGWLWAWDEWLLAHVPALRRWCRYIIIEYSV